MWQRQRSVAKSAAKLWRQIHQFREQRQQLQENPPLFAQAGERLGQAGKIELRMLDKQGTQCLVETEEFGVDIRKGMRERGGVGQFDKLPCQRAHRRVLEIGGSAQLSHPMNEGL